MSTTQVGLNDAGKMPPIQGRVHLVVMGVSGCGKSTVGAQLALALEAAFLDGDSLHPPANIEKMRSGTPLDDDDRKPWLSEIGARFAAAGDRPLVIACSALRRRYRDIIRSGAPDVVFIHLHGSESLLAERMSVRPGHFMPPSLLRSQLDTLEPLTPDEPGLTIDINRAPNEIVARATAWLTAYGIQKDAS